MKNIAVIGFDNDLCSNCPEILQAARTVGRLLAKAGYAVLTGGGGGVMSEAAAGAQEASGITLSFVSSAEKRADASGSDICLPTGLGWGGHSLILIRAADAVIAIGGGAGTLLELCAAYLHEKPVVAMTGFGGWTDRLFHQQIRSLDERAILKIVFESDPETAVNRLMQLIGGIE